MIKRNGCALEMRTSSLAAALRRLHVLDTAVPLMMPLFGTVVGLSLVFLGLFGM
jgi:hypothetical protein